MLATADLAPLPLAVLASLARGRADFKLLEMWGLRTLGDFMKLPRQALAERLGPEVGRWHDVLHAKFCRLLRLHRPPESFLQSYDFEEPVVSLEPLVFALKRMLHTLGGRLAARHLAARELDFQLTLGIRRVRRGASCGCRSRRPRWRACFHPCKVCWRRCGWRRRWVLLVLDAGTTFATARSANGSAATCRNRNAGRKRWRNWRRC